MKTPLIMLPIALAATIGCYPKIREGHGHSPKSEVLNTQSLNLHTSPLKDYSRIKILIPASAKQKSAMEQEAIFNLKKPGLPNDLKKETLEKLRNLSLVNYMSTNTKRTVIQVSPKLKIMGQYEILVKWATAPSLHQEASFSVISKMRRQKKCIAHLKADAEWNSVGTYEFDIDTNVQFSYLHSNGTDLVDAIKVLPAEEATGNLIIDINNCDESVVAVEGTGWKKAKEKDAINGEFMTSYHPTAQIYITPYLHRAGFYRLSMKKIHSRKPYEVKAIVEHREGQTELDVASHQITGEWFDIGTFEFTRGYGGNLSFISNPGKKFSIDALKMTYVGTKNLTRLDKSIISIVSLDSDFLEVNGDWDTVYKNDGSSFLLNIADNSPLDSNTSLIVKPSVTGTHEIRIKWPLEALSEPYQELLVTVTSGSNTTFHQVTLNVDDAETWFSLGNANLSEKDTIILQRNPRSPNEGGDKDLAVVGFQLLRK